MASCLDGVTSPQSTVAAQINQIFHHGDDGCACLLVASLLLHLLCVLSSYLFVGDLREPLPYRPVYNEPNFFPEKTFRALFCFFFPLFSFLLLSSIPIFPERIFFRFFSHLCPKTACFSIGVELSAAQL